MKVYTVGELKRNFSSLLDEVRNGQRIVVAFGRKREKIAIIAPYDGAESRRRLGLLAESARCKIGPDFAMTDEQFLAS